MPPSTPFYCLRYFNVLAVPLSTPFLYFRGIICGPMRGSLTVLGSFAVQCGDHLRSRIICGLGIICGAVQVSLKSLSLFSKTIVRRYCSFKLEKKTFNTYKWKEKVQKNTGSRRKLQVTKAAFKGPHRFVFFTAESLPCSEAQPSK